MDQKTNSETGSSASKRKDKIYDFPSLPLGPLNYPYGPPIIFTARGMGPPDMRIIALGVGYSKLLHLTPLSPHSIPISSAFCFGFEMAAVAAFRR